MHAPSSLDATWPALMKFFLRCILLDLKALHEDIRRAQDVVALVSEFLSDDIPSRAST
jgi:hypothetical protein